MTFQVVNTGKFRFALIVLIVGHDSSLESLIVHGLQKIGAPLGPMRPSLRIPSKRYHNYPMKCP
jgi:hypothetical protein